MQNLNFAYLIIPLSVSLIFFTFQSEKQFVKPQIKALRAAAYVVLLYVSLKQLDTPPVAISLVTVILVGKVYYKSFTAQQKGIGTRVNTQQSENIQVKPQEENEAPPLQIRPPVEEVSESEQSNQLPAQNTTARFATDENGPKLKSNLSFLGDFKKSLLEKSQPQQLNARQSLLQINQNTNLIKYQDESGEIKLGILKTLKSISYDHIGKELDSHMLAERNLTHLLSQVEKSDAPNSNIKILYESSQPEPAPANNSQMQERVHLGVPVPERNFGDRMYEMNLKTEQSIFPARPRLSWINVLKQVLVLFVFGTAMGFRGNLAYDLLNISALSVLQTTGYILLILLGLEITLQPRELIAWILLIGAAPLGMTVRLLMPLFLSNIPMAWIALVLAAPCKGIPKYQHSFCLLYFLLGTLATFY